MGLFIFTRFLKLCPFSIEIWLLLDYSVTFEKLKCYSLPFPAEPVFSKVLGSEPVRKGVANINGTIRNN